MADYVAFDFETANAHRASACALGAVRIRDGQTVSTLSMLIDPEAGFDGMNVSIHGIDAGMVVGAPTFPQAYADLMSFADGAEVLVGHSAAFDVQVLRQSAARYGVDVVQQPFACTRVFARQWWSGWPSYSLPYIHERLGLGPSDGHHDALWDAAACARIAEAGLREGDFASWAAAAAAVSIRLGIIRAADYDGCVSASGGGSYNPIRPRPAVLGMLDEAHPLYRVTVAFTGALSYYTRREAAQLVADVGGVFAANVSGKTDLLVVGEHDLARLAGHDVSSKMRKAVQLAEKGVPIEIIDETEFYALL